MSSVPEAAQAMGEALGAGAETTGSAGFGPRGAAGAFSDPELGVGPQFTVADGAATGRGIADCRLADCRLADCRLDTFREITEPGGYFLSRRKTGTKLYQSDGRELDLRSIPKRWPWQSGIGPGAPRSGCTRTAAWSRPPLPSVATP